MTLIKKMVNKLIKKHNSCCPFEISKSAGIIIQYVDLGDTLGFYFQDSRVKIININQNLSKPRQRFVVAHELGHAFQHPKANTPFMKKNTLLSVDRIEVEANTFAVELLLPDKIIYEHKDEFLTLNEIANIYGVPEEVAHLKCLRNVRRVIEKSK